MKTLKDYLAQVSPLKPIIAWWSGGITSAVTCKLCVDAFGPESVLVVFIDTHNEDDDTFRFMRDCEAWYGCKIQSISNKNYDNIQEVWEKHLSLNVANGAICSAELKRRVRQDFQNRNIYSCQAFGFEITEYSRAKNMTKNYPNSRPIFPLITEVLTKEDCIAYVQKAGINPPNTYALGFSNNNCFKTGCVQGGIGYWQKMQNQFPEKFDVMAALEHRLTDEKGSPVTMLKDQGKNKGLVFLKPHPAYPDIKHLGLMKGREPKPLMECNGFCEPKN